MDFSIILILVLGFFAGVINTIAGGGSLVVVPVLIFLGLPPTVANASNRVAIAIQNIFGVAGYRRKGVSNFRYTSLLASFAVVGTLFGSYLALKVSGEDFKKILSGVMIMVLVLILWKPGKKKAASDLEMMAPKHQMIGAIVFFFIGIYGGFIQSGVGFIILAALSSINGLDLIKANSIKVGVIFLYTTVAVCIFAYHGKINWYYGIVLSVGNAAGAWIGSQWAVERGEKWVQHILTAAVLIMAIKLSGIIDKLYQLIF